MENKTQMQIGPALAIVIIIGLIAIAGIFFYKDMVKGLTHKEQGYTINRDLDRFNNKTATETEDAMMMEKESAGPALATSTDLDSIEADLEASLEADLSILDELDEELLDFEDLDDFDFEL